MADTFADTPVLGTASSSSPSSTDLETALLLNANDDDDNNNNSNNSNDNDAVPPTGLSSWLFILMCVSALVASCGFALAAPYLPEEARESYSCGSVCVGFIFSVQPAFAFIGSPLCSQILKRRLCSRRLMLILSLNVAGLAFVAFAFVMKLPKPHENQPPVLFVATASIIRAVSGLASGAVDTTVFAMIASLCNHEQAHLVRTQGEESTSSTTTTTSTLGDRMGKLELAYGLGFAVGPAVGAGLYALGGFLLPFLVVGGLTVVLVAPALQVALQMGPHADKSERARQIASLVELSEESEAQGDDEEQCSVGGLVLARPGALAALCSAALSCACFGALDPSLQIYILSSVSDAHAKEATSAVGLLFCLVAFCYCLATVPVGRIADRAAPHACIAAGLVGIAVGFFLLGTPKFPIPYLGEAWAKLLPNVIARSAVALCVIGPSAALTFVPSMPALIMEARKRNGIGRNDNWPGEEVWHDSLSGALSAAWSAGAFVGPLAGGAVVRGLGFDDATGVFCVVLGAMAALQLASMLY